MRFFERKTCYSVHGDHAFLVSTILYRSTAQVSTKGDRTASGLPSVTVSLNLFPCLVRQLLVEGGDHAVEVYEGSGCSWRRTR